MKKLSTILLILILLIGCSSNNQSKSPSAQPEYDEMPVGKPAEPTMPDVAPMPVPPSEGGVFDPTKIVKSGQFNLETREFDKDFTNLNQLIETVKGFVQNSSVTGVPTDNNPTSTRTLYLTLRIPVEQFDPFINQLKKDYSVIYEQTNSTSVADAYYDSENRIEVLEVQQKRLLELLEKAENLSDVVLLQDQLMQVEYELNIHKGTINKLDDQINYSTINLTVFELSSDDVSVQTNSFFDEVGRAFNRGLNSIISTLQNVTLFVVENIVWLAALLIIGVVVYRKTLKKQLPLKTKKDIEHSQE